jgi:hypothetical protein
MASLIRRGFVYYIQHCMSGKVRRISTGTKNQQLAKKKGATIKCFGWMQTGGNFRAPPSRLIILETSPF